MGKLSDFLVGVPGYFREGEDESFPWGRTDKAVWYALFVVEGGKIERYGYTASKTSKANLRAALTALSKDEEALLLGVWTGEYSTHLFVLSIPSAIIKLQT